MLTKVDIGWTVLFNDHNGQQCPALVTKVYTPNNSQSVLDLHVVGINSNASFARGKLEVSYGTLPGQWQYTNTREISINSNDLPIDGESLIYNSTTDSFETEPITNLATDVDGGVF